MKIKKIVGFLWKPLANESGFIGGKSITGGAREKIQSATEVEAPEMSEEELGLLRQLQNQINIIARTNAALLPELFRQLGFQVVEGKLSPLALDELMAGLSPLQRGQVENLLASDKQLGMAIRGEAGFSPGLERDIAKFERVSGEETRRQLGANFLRSSAGPAAFSDIESFGVRERERARGAAIDRFGNVSSQIRGQRGQTFAQLASLYKPETVLQGLSASQQPYQFYAGLGLQSAIESKRQEADFYKGIQGSIGGGSFGGISGGSAR